MNRAFNSESGVLSFELAKNSTLGYDSGFSASREESALNLGMNTSGVISDISGGGASMRLGEFQHKNIFMLLIIHLDETGTIDDDDLLIIPHWLFDDLADAEESSLLIHCNFDCLIDQSSLDEVSLTLPRRKRDVPPPRPRRSLDYVRVSNYSPTEYLNI